MVTVVKPFAPADAEAHDELCEYVARWIELDFGHTVLRLYKTVDPEYPQRPDLRVISERTRHQWWIDVKTPKGKPGEDRNVAVEANEFHAQSAYHPMIYVYPHWKDGGRLVDVTRDALIARQIGGRRSGVNSNGGSGDDFYVFRAEPVEADRRFLAILEDATPEDGIGEVVDAMMAQFDCDIPLQLGLDGSAVPLTDRRESPMGETQLFLLRHLAEGAMRATDAGVAMHLRGIGEKHGERYADKRPRNQHLHHAGCCHAAPIDAWPVLDSLAKRGVVYKAPGRWFRLIRRNDENWPTV